MNLNIPYQKHYSRLGLLVRSFFGWLYIVIPHYFILFFLWLWSSTLWFLSFLAILFTGKYPKNWFEFQVNYSRWSIRVLASLWNLYDGFPAFGLSEKESEKEQVQLNVPYPETVSRGQVLLIGSFGFIFVLIPHGIALFFRAIAGAILGFLAFWIVLFTGKYPQNWHSFHEGTIRWICRVWFYIFFMNPAYPPFSGKE